jgi:hypothetical protein
MTNKNLYISKDTSDAYALQRNDFRVTHLYRALGNDNFCSKVDPLLIIRALFSSPVLSSTIYSTLFGTRLNYGFCCLFICDNIRLCGEKHG